jgi:hypothetical protein
MYIPSHITENLLYLEPLPEGQPAEGVDDKFPLPEVCRLEKVKKISIKGKS